MNHVAQPAGPEAAAAKRVTGGPLTVTATHRAGDRIKTRLDQHLIGGGKGISDLCFGSEVGAALKQRADFLGDQGLAERQGQHVILARNLFATLRGRELAAVGQSIAAETGLAHRPVADGERVSGVYRRSVMLSPVKYFAVLDDGLGFRLVPWKPVIEQ